MCAAAESWCPRLREGDAPPCGQHLVLIGFMGVGKSRVARELGRQTGLFVVDTDELIESCCGMSIAEIFQQQGEARFRDMEQQLALWLRHQSCTSIISTGGGFFMAPDLQKMGTIIYLHASMEAIMEAIINGPQARLQIEKRPLLADLAKARVLFARRLPLYRVCAHHEVNMEGKNIVQAAAEIKLLLDQGRRRA